MVGLGRGDEEEKLYYVGRGRVEWGRAIPLQVPFLKLKTKWHEKYKKSYINYYNTDTRNSNSGLKKYKFNKLIF